MKPSNISLFTHLLAEEYAQKSHVPKPTAMGTPLRYSGAFGCGRQMGYNWSDAEFSNPPTAGSLFQAMLGTIIGEAQANAMIAKYGGIAEVPSKVNEWISGSADWFSHTTPLGTVVYEHKMKASYAFNKAMGYKRGFGKASLVDPEGPPLNAVVQAGMNALGIERTYSLKLRDGGVFLEPEIQDFSQILLVNAVVVGIVSADVISVSQNKQINVGDLARFSAEWVIPRGTWEPAALKEIDRLGGFAEMMDLGYLPDRFALDDTGEHVELNPGGKNWQCDYCPFKDLCESDGAGQIRVLDSKLTRRVDITTKETV